jgi:hypothetical protein
LIVTLPKTRTVGTRMPKSSRPPKRKNLRPNLPADPAESRASEAVTIAWTSSVTGVFVADLIVIASHLYARGNLEARAAQALDAIMLLSAAAMGTISLALLAVVWRARQLKPPRGYMAFATLATAAPIIALIGRLLL